jgi:PKD repeat protein
MYHDTGYSGSADRVQLQVSTDGGSVWQDVGTAVNRYDGTSGWKQHSINLTGFTGPLTDVRIAFLGISAYGNDCHLDDVAVESGTPPPPTVPCVAPASGGLIYGNVYDANTLAPLAGATVSNATTGGTAVTAATPDPNVDDAFYCMYGAEGANTMSATKTLYGPDNQSATVPHYGVVQRDFHLATGQLAASPASLSWATVPGGTGGTTLTLSNIGGADVNWTVHELSGHVLRPTGNLFTFNLRPHPAKGEMLTRAFLEERAEEAAREERRDSKSEKEAVEAKEKKVLESAADARTRASAERAVPASPAGASAAGRKTLPSSPGKLAPGDVIASWASGLAVPWGVAFDGGDNTVWVGDPGPSWGGSNKMYEYSPAGAPTGRTQDFTWTHSSGPGDFAYNWNTGNIWVMNINTGVNNCIYEVNPATGPTGNSICPGGGTGFATSERGLAYDPVTDTFFAGGWNSLTITHFNAAGVILDSVNVGLSISGLAYNPATQHLFAMTNASPNLVYVLDAANSYAILGSFAIAGFTDYSGAGLEIDCQGNLWAPNQVDLNVYEVSSGEAASLCDIPWLDENPKTGTVTAGGSTDVDVTYDATGLAPGIYEATLSFANDTPYGPLNVPVTLTVAEPVVPVATAVPVNGLAPLTVAFTGTATGGIGTYSYDWNFGDGSPHSSAQNPSHTYNIGGSFTVTLTVTASVTGSGVDNHLVIAVTPPAIPVVNNFTDDAPRNLEQACFNRLTGAYVWTVLSGPHAGTVFTGTAAVYNAGAKFTNKPADPNKFSVVYDPVKHKASGWLISGGVYYPLTDSNTTNNPPGCY